MKHTWYDTLVAWQEHQPPAGECSDLSRKRTWRVSADDETYKHERLVQLTTGRFELIVGCRAEDVDRVALALVETMTALEKPAKEAE